MERLFKRLVLLATVLLLAPPTLAESQTIDTNPIISQDIEYTYGLVPMAQSATDFASDLNFTNDNGTNSRQSLTHANGAGEYTGMRYVQNRIDSKADPTSSAHRMAQLQFNSVAVLNDHSLNLNAIKSANNATLDTRRDYTHRAKSALGVNTA
ncbi:MAG: hypothetical protein BRC25_02620 [Parcubacteria group bacterium SW_6_46_9]|nr:MAG: hypothetical protein BRC25_02620 [Parcubacteria group bacterium SW_6_46_9]